MTQAGRPTESSELPVVEGWCDGACKGNPGPGGWGVLLRFGKHERELSGYAKHTTNNKMELTAAIELLNALKKPCRITVHTDSTYVIKGMEEWIHGWKKRGWLNSQKKPVENKELWMALDRLRNLHDVRWQWVKGHAGHVENERVDALASAEAERAALLGGR